MGEPTSIKASISVPGKSNGRFSIPLTLETVSKWIKLQGFDNYTTEELIKLAEKYPTHALPGFRKNFNLMVERVRIKRKKELHAEKISENSIRRDETNSECSASEIKHEIESKLS